MGGLRLDAGSYDGAGAAPNAVANLLSVGDLTGAPSPSAARSAWRRASKLLRPSVAQRYSRAGPSTSTRRPENGLRLDDIVELVGDSD
jgi:hypothetical protein